MSWSSSNQLAVALMHRLFVWNASTGDINQLMELEESEYISSVSWVKEGSFLGIGTSNGDVQVSDRYSLKIYQSSENMDKTLCVMSAMSRLL